MWFFIIEGAFRGFKVLIIQSVFIRWLSILLRTLFSLFSIVLPQTLLCPSDVQTFFQNFCVYLQRTFGHPHISQATLDLCI